MLMFLPVSKLRKLNLELKSLQIKQIHEHNNEPKDTHWRKVPDVKISVMKLIFSFLVSTHEL